MNVTFRVEHDDMVTIIPNHFVFKPDSPITNVSGSIFGRSPGNVLITAEAQPGIIE